MTVKLAQHRNLFATVSYSSNPSERSHSPLGCTPVDSDNPLIQQAECRRIRHEMYLDRHAYLESETIPAINIKTDIKKLNSTTIKPRNRRISNSSEKSAQHCETTITLSYLRLRSFSSKEVTPSNFPTKVSLLFVMALYSQEFS